MATTERDQSVPPQSCELGEVMWDIGKDVPGIVMGHHGGDRVQMRAVSGGKEWDALKVRPLTARERLSLHLAARNDASRNRP
ncbi:hypothetical protein SEA_JANUS_50 [Streptomyces phage Janus]|uniref:Uncharacterized protein n=1 Tax=Streptomyces phage Janus TaxID=2510525 RepID=A0A411CPT5_9CAUD|nr:hypothetical protein KGG75_gp50 [Streptomyces phage Janus]ATI18912.1 hypothetical protein SEA_SQUEAKYCLEAN_49 [Streptomyces phage SqueakyClean]QAY15954.1 hypothetical protein SEA_JANUS_50 [Streptomyces phage Janus]QFG10717.1 hypothetical protein SEA_ANIMUS_49 [Streptomyces phage Animus]